MSQACLEWRKYRYFPYEREFAKLETEQLFGALSGENAVGLTIPSGAFRSDGAERLTYFGRAVHPGGAVVVPRQVRLEASANDGERQATRYSAHGIHEYKGKFNPQIVRAIGNMLGLDKGATVLDPFCGSGTTLLECAHSGWNAVGVDRNPLAVQITNAKLHALRRRNGAIDEKAMLVTRALERAADRLCVPFEPRRSDVASFLDDSWLDGLPSRKYLCAWFPPAVLAQIVAILRVLRAQVRSRDDRAVFEIILSDQLRQASLQEPADLRIRRRKDPEANYPLIQWFTEALKERLDRIERARQTLGRVEGRQEAMLGDVRSADQQPATFGRIDAVITSPPYETALPYIDTQRLSLVVLGAIEAGEIQATEKALIGARDISGREREEIESQIAAGTGDLPVAVLGLCRELLEAAKKPGNGFRRVNRPALTYRYFNNMSAFFTNSRRWLRPGGKVAMVVGANRTVLGGKEYIIDTPRLLVAVAQRCGYSRTEERAMNTYPRYDIHQKNSIESETLIVLTAN